MSRIVSWRINEPRVSPSQSSASPVSVVSINSIVSDMHIMTTEATGVQPVELGAKFTNLPRSSDPAANASFVRHDTYFFKDGNITFLVRDALYCAPSLLKKGCRSMAHSIVFIGTFSLATRSTSLPSLASSTSVITNH
jgi:hypothetical protein